MTSKPKFSVIVPAYNSEKHIAKGLESISTQSYKDFELIVVCDSCVDNTEEVAKRYGARTISVDYGTDGLTRDAGLRMATGDWILFMDDDDWFMHEFCFQQLADVLDKIDVDVLCFGYICKGRGYMRQSFEEINDDRCVNVWSKCWKRSVLGDAHFGNVQYCSDRYFVRRALRNVRSIGFWDMPIYYYNFMRKGSQTDMLVHGYINTSRIPAEIYTGKEV